MNLEQRIEVLEQAVKALAGNNLTVENGQIYINDAFLKKGSIKEAIVKATNEVADRNINSDDELISQLDEGIKFSSAFLALLK